MCLFLLLAKEWFFGWLQEGHARRAREAPQDPSRDHHRLEVVYAAKTVVMLASNDEPRGIHLLMMACAIINSKTRLNSTWCHLANMIWNNLLGLYTLSYILVVYSLASSWSQRHSTTPHSAGGRSHDAYATNLHIIYYSSLIRYSSVDGEKDALME